LVRPVLRGILVVYFGWQVAEQLNSNSHHAHYMKCSFISDSYTPFLSMSAKNIASSLEFPSASKSSIVYNDLLPTTIKNSNYFNSFI